MPFSLNERILPRLIGFTVLLYGLIVIMGSFVRQLRLHGRHDIDAFFTVLPLLFGLSYIYLGSLLVRRKYNAWLTAMVLAPISAIFGLVQLVHGGQASTPHGATLIRIVLPLLILLLLYASRRSFKVRSDLVSFQQAVRVSVILLLVAFLYGVAGFLLLDKHDFHQHITVAGAMQQTIDQFGLTTNTVIAHTKRAHLFLDSLSIVSVASLAYIAVSFFQPLRLRLSSEIEHRALAEKLLDTYPSDLDDYFKLWPTDKHYCFDSTERAGLAYHVSRGTALVVGDPFGDRARFKQLMKAFLELCFVNDWQPSFIHVSDRSRHLYEVSGFRMQKIGEEAVVDLEHFRTQKDGKYFRQIRNRFTKLAYSVELLQPPHSNEIINQLRAISNEWLERPGREERGFMLGYFDEAYLQSGAIAVARDAEGKIQGFMNLVRTFEADTANYDLLRCSKAAPGNCNDFLVLGLIEELHALDIRTLNLGLCPLAGLDSHSKDATLVDGALRFVYANGDRFYSFSGLRRFKAKYEPNWEPRYVAYQGGIRNFTRTLTALNRAMKVK